MPSPPAGIQRGDVWWADLSPVRGHEQAGRRPVLIVSDDSFNRSGLDMVIVAPLTRAQRGWPTRVSISPPEGGLSAPSEIMGDQIRTIAAERLEQHLGRVQDETLEQVATILRLILAL